MSGRWRALGVVLSTGLAGLTLPSARAAPAVSAEMTRCAAIAAPDERLACYDALVCAAIVAAEERLACYDTLAKPKLPDVQTSPGDAVRPKSSATDTQSFGLSPRQLPATPESPKLIKALVTRVTVDRAGNVLMSLDNGQSWTFNDQDALFRPGDSVTIRRAALGSFLLTAGRRSYRARRVQ